MIREALRRLDSAPERREGAEELFRPGDAGEGHDPLAGDVRAVGSRNEIGLERNDPVRQLLRYARLVRTDRDYRVGAGKTGCGRFPQGPRRQEPAVAEAVGTVDDDDGIDLFDGCVLMAVVHDRHRRARIGRGGGAGRPVG